jgi:Zn-dependent protease/CBS domain-containing protein
VFGGGSIQLMRISGIRIGASPSWFVVLFLVIYFLSGYFRDTLGGTQTEGFIVAVCSAILFFGSLILHELGHALVARRNGIEIDGIDLWLLGGLARFKQDSRTPGEEFAIAAAGPAVSLLLALTFAGLSVAVAGTGDAIDVALLRNGVDISPSLALLVFLAEMNVWLFLFNLIPAFPLDGGRIARSIAWQLTGDRTKATRFAAFLGQIFAGLLILYGLYQLFTSRDAFGGLWYVALGWMLGGGARAAVAQSAFTQRLEGVTVADIMDAEPVTIPASVSATQAWEDYFLRYQGWPWFAVVEDDGRFAGLAHRAAVEHAAYEREERPVRELATPSASDTQVRADASLESLLSSEPLLRLGALMAVDAEGRLRGVVTREQLERALRARLAAT